MAQDHFQTPPDPHEGYERSNKSKRIQACQNHYLGGRIRDLGKGAFGMWAFIAHGGLSKPTVRTEPLNLFRASKNMGPIFLEKKRRLRQRTHKFRASRNLGAIFLEKKGACGNVPTSSGLP